MKPNFMCVGAAKAGTTWLHLCLESHPEIYVPNRKEIHFFSYPYLYEKGMDWYESFFQDVASETAIVDISVSYMNFPNVPEKIHAYNPDIRLLFVLRNPVQRAYSHYCMALRSGHVGHDIRKVLTPESPWVRAGFYFHHISQFLNYFSPEQIKVVFFDDMKNDPAAFLKDVYSFLEVDSSFVPPDMHKPRNAAKALPRFPKLYHFLKGNYRKIMDSSEPMRRILESLRFRGFFDAFHWLNQGPEPPALSSDTAQFLAQCYQEDVQSLSKMLNRELSPWLEPYLKTN